MSIYKTQSVTNDNQSLHNKFLEKLSALPFPTTSFSFLFSSIFLAAKHSYEDDNSEDVRLDLFLLEEVGYWLGFKVN